MTQTKVAFSIASLEARRGGPPVAAAGLAGALASRLDVTMAYQAHEGTEVALHDEVTDQPLSWVGGGPQSLASLIAQSDIVHVHGIYGAILARTMLEAWRRSVPCVLTPHGMLNTTALELKSTKKRLAFGAGLRRLLSRSAAMIAVSDYERECIRRWGYQGPVEVIPNGVDLLAIDGDAHARAPTRGEIRPDRALAEDDYIIFLGRLDHDKGVEILVRAFARVHARRQSARLVLIGPDWGAQATIAEVVRELHLSEAVDVLPPRYGDEKFGVLKGAACFCMPSKFESFSVSVVEAMACRCPVVLTPGCNFDEVESFGAGVVVDRSEDALADALVSYLDDPDLRSRAGAAGRRAVEEHYRWERLAEQTEAIYERVR